MLFNLTVVGAQLNPYYGQSVFQPQTWVRLQEQGRDFWLVWFLQGWRERLRGVTWGQRQGSTSEGQQQGGRAALGARGKPGRGTLGGAPGPREGRELLSSLRPAASKPRVPHPSSVGSPQPRWPGRCEATARPEAMTQQ